MPKGESFELEQVRYEEEERQKWHEFCLYELTGSKTIDLWEDIMIKCSKILRPVAFLLISLLIIGLTSMVSSGSLVYADQGTVGPLPKEPDTTKVGSDSEEDDGTTILDVLADILGKIF